MPSRTYGGATGEQRREKRRAALQQAALDLVAEAGWDRVTVRAVCAHARLNDRYFYESYPDCDALLLATRDSVAAEALRTLRRAIADTGPEERVRAVVETVIDFFTADPRRGPLMLDPHEATRDRRREMVAMMAGIVADQATELLGARAAPPKDRELGALTLVNGTLEVFTGWLRGEVDVTREHLADFLVAMVNITGDLSVALDQVRRAPATPRAARTPRTPPPPRAG